MSDLLERAKAFLARAGHPGTPEEEARTSAVLGARLMVEQGFVLVRAEDVRTTSTPVNPPHPSGHVPHRSKWDPTYRDGKPEHWEPPPVPPPNPKHWQAATNAADRSDLSDAIKRSQRFVAGRVGREGLGLDEALRDVANINEEWIDLQPEVKQEQHFVSMPARSPSTCRACGRIYMIGDRVAWSKQAGYTHLDPACAEIHETLKGAKR